MNIGALKIIIVMLNLLSIFRSKLSSINELENYNINISNLRNSYKILLIDDGDFENKDLLHNRDFNITHVKDIDAISMTSEYDMILCDIKGVGKKVGSKYEGAYLIKEIKRKYPLKTVLAYTGETHKADYNRFFFYADDVLKKDMSLDDLSETFDRHIEITVNPKKKWKRACLYLFNQDVSTYSIALLEDKYVKLIKSKKEIDIIHFLKETNIENTLNEASKAFIKSTFKEVTNVIKQNLIS